MKTAILSLVLSSLSMMLNAQTQWIEFTQTEPQSPIIQLISSDNQSVSFSAEICGMFQTDTMVNNSLFQRIIIPDGGRLNIKGHPEMPYIRQLIAIPECDSVILQVEINDSTTIEDSYIYPAPDYQEVINPDSTINIEEVFAFDSITYNINQFNPEVNAEIHSMGYFRDQKYAEIYLYPICFNPVSEEIKVDMNYDITLTFVNPITSENVNVGIFNNIATHTMLNYKSTGISAVINDNVNHDGTIDWIILTDPSQASTIVADYLIICAQPFFQPNNPESELLKIASHRAQYNGFDVAIVEVSNIINLYYDPENYPYEGERAIRDFVRYVYEGNNAQHTYDGKLGYVLLIGDAEKDSDQGVPTAYDETYSHPATPNDNYPSDYYYCCVTKENSDYDEIGDLSIGRFVVDNNLENGIIELHNIIKKTIFYEQEYSLVDWKKNVSFTNGSVATEEYFQVYYSFIENLLDDEIPFIVDYYPLNGQIQQPTIDNLNQGTFLMTYIGHGDQYAWQNGGMDITILEAELINSGIFPVVISKACETGHFDLQFLNDCFGEALTTYSDMKGFVGFLGAGRIMVGWYIEPIFPPKFIHECIPYAIWNDNSYITGEFVLEAKIYCLNPPEKYAYNYFGDPGMNLMAQGYEITHSVTISDSASITKEVFLRSGNSVTVPSESTLLFKDDGKLIVEEGAALNILDNANLSAISGADSLIIYGTLLVGQNVHFSASEDASLVIDIRNSELSETIHGASFENVTVIGTANSLYFSSCSFTNSFIEMHHNENCLYLFYQSDFDNTPLIACRVGSGPSMYRGGIIVINECDFINGAGLHVIKIESFPNFQIINTNLSYVEGDGIGLYYSGNATGTMHKVSNCNICFTGNPADGIQGIKVYYSRVELENNYIHGNDIGLECLRRSSISLTGNSQAEEEDETQRIKDNISIQVYVDNGSSFPYEFEYNSIYNDNEDDYVVKMDSNIFNGYDIRNNYWGENFLPEDDLFPTNAYLYLPVWEPLWGSKKSSEVDKALFYSAKQAIADSNYSEAKTKFKELIENYPGSKYQKAAIKEILQLTDLYDQDYSGLKMYLDTVPSLWENEEIIGITEYIMIWCDIRLQNYSAAITWFEDRILNPISFTDSILSIIDLGYVYSLMESGGSRCSGFTGKLPQYRPTSQKVYSVYREHLIDLLPPSQPELGQDSITTPAIHTTAFLQTYPNPLADNLMTINYYLLKDAKVVINIYNTTGELIEKVLDAYQYAGENACNWNNSTLESGIYFITLVCNSETLDYQKIMVIK